MSVILKSSLGIFQSTLLSRTISSSTALCTQQWRVAQGLSANKNAEGILTDGPDFTYLDGRPTPLLRKQKIRIERQRAYASKIVEMCAELDFAKDRYQKTLQAEEDKRQNVLANRLKPKGAAMHIHNKK